MADSVFGYQQIFLPVFLKEENTINIAIRSFSRSNEKCFLIVDPYNFKTSVKNIEQLIFRKPVNTNSNEPGYFSWEEIKNTPYVKTLFKYTSSDHYKIENAGLISFKNANGAFLTIDMCPSNNPFEKEFFALLAKNNNNVPVAIAISGLWLISHEKEFKWLLEQQSKGAFNITWVNHSFSHIYLHDLPNEENFLAFSLTNVNLELLETEKLLIENNQIPSVFFRFPGLVSNKRLMEELRGYGLIPLGAESWIAKNQPPSFTGDIILLHGNGNEPEGIRAITPYINNPDNQWLSLCDDISS